MPIPTTRPSSSKPPATSTWKTTTPAPKSSRSMKRPSTRMPPPRWPRRHSPKMTKTKKTTASIQPSPAKWPAAGRRRKAAYQPGTVGAGHGHGSRRRSTEWSGTLGRSARCHHGLPVLRGVRRSRPGSEPLRIPVRRDHGLGIGPHDRRNVRRLTHRNGPADGSQSTSSRAGSNHLGPERTRGRSGGRRPRTIVPERRRNEWFVLA